jgi:hypothetical protein
VSTNTSFTFRGIEDVGGGATLDDVRDLLRGSEPASLLAPGTIGAQTAGQGSGIPMGALRRGLLGPLYGNANYTVPSTTYAELDSKNLAGILVCSGRPVRVDFSAGMNMGTSNGLIVSASMDGVEVTQKYDGLGWVYTAGDFFITGWRILTPRPGPRRFALIAKLNAAGSGTVYGGTDDVCQMAVTEL